jgi:prefoldin subunit 4
MDDASTELMMGSGDKVMLFMGEAFLEATEEEATEFCEAQVELQQAKMDALNEEETNIIEQQEVLKKELYGRFGKSIQLEDK